MANLCDICSDLTKTRVQGDDRLEIKAQRKRMESPSQPSFGVVAKTTPIQDVKVLSLARSISDADLEHPRGLHCNPTSIRPPANDASSCSSAGTCTCGTRPQWSRTAHRRGPAQEGQQQQVQPRVSHSHQD